MVFMTPNMFFHFNQRLPPPPQLIWRHTFSCHITQQRERLTFQGSSRPWSLSASPFSFIWFSGVNSPSCSRFFHSWQARAKNSLLRAVPVRRTEQSPPITLSACGSSCTSRYWQTAGRDANVCLFSRAWRTGDD